MREALERKPRKSETLTGRNVIEDYINGKPFAIDKYKQLLVALNQFEIWDNHSRTTFLSQFLDIYDLLDANCSEIVLQFCQLKWHTIPTSLRKNFVEFLSAIALNHIVHVETVLKTATEHFKPEMKVDESIIIPNSIDSMNKMVQITPDEIQEEIYTLAHYCIHSIVTCLPLSVHTLLSCCELNYPHYRHPTDKLLAYNQNLILLSENYEVISNELWSLIIDKLIYIDALISAKKYNEDEINIYDTGDIFEMDETFKEEIANKNSIESKLDLIIAQIILYISEVYKEDSNFLQEHKNDINFKWVKTLAKKNLNLFNVMLTGFDEHVLYSYDIHSVSYLWFYLCSCCEKICDAMLSYLWNLIKSSLSSPNDWKKSHNAAATLCGFLARANYISLSVACKWLKTIAQWCCNYADNMNYIKFQSGSIQHGTFYATVQALLFVICYRYKEFKKVEEIHLWGLSRIVHSQLEPLRFISQAVALCFADVSRYLQIVYCNHIVSAEESLRQRIVELYFPFSFCSLNLCSSKILPLMRKFSSTYGEVK